MLTLELEDPACSGPLREVALKLRSSKKTVFVAGAGISCNAGIPDFRSKDGLYALVKKQNQDALVKGKDLFDIILFRDARSTEIFYSFMAGLRDATVEAQPTPTHNLLKLLKDKKKLMRCYTQNIDGLEFRAGLGLSDTVQLHGNIHQLKCMHCSQAYDWSPEYTNKMQEGDAPQCENCINSSLARSLSGKRSTAIGQLRPDIVLYGEDHPSGDEIAMTLRKDTARSPQLLVVAGTSLKVIGIKRLVKTLAKATHAAGGMTVFVNKTPISKSEWDQVFDFHVLADTDAWVAEMRRQIPSFWERQTKIHVDRKRKAATSEPVNLEKVLAKNEVRAPTPIPSDAAHSEPANEPREPESRPESKPESNGAFNMAKRTKSDPYADTVQQNMLLKSPSSVKSFTSEYSLSQDLSSPPTEVMDLPDDIPTLKLE